MMLTETATRPLQSEESLWRALDDSMAMENLCKSDFQAFFHFVFSRAIKIVDGEFVPGKHIGQWCHRLQNHNRTATIAARYHMKSTTAIAYIAWQLYKLDRPFVEWEYMCYLEGLAAYHLKRLKRYLAVLPEFSEYENLTIAESILRCKYKGCEFLCIPSGILSFNRGRHPDGLMVDDILKDPSTKLDIGQLKKIEQLFFEEIEQMPKKELHVFGTTQDQADLFHTLLGRKEYSTKFYPAVKNFTTQEVLWPQKFPFSKLMDMKARIGEKAFNKEIQLHPARSEDSYIGEQRLDAIVRGRLRNYDLSRTKPVLREFAYGGFDIGKKSHPSHFSILVPDRKQRMIQVLSKWMDGWDYTRQIEYINEAIEHFQIERLYYDNTRSEFEGFAESGILKGECEPLVFSAKSKFAMAADLDKFITANKIWLLNDERQKRQLINVDNDLQSLQTDEGHGDCFWSLCLAVKAYTEGQGDFIRIINYETTRLRAE